MRHSLRVCAALFACLLVGPLSAAENAAEAEARLRETVTFLSSDALEGRGVGTAGLNKAADYLATQFQSLGLKTDLFNGTPFQEFEIVVAAEMGPDQQNQLAFRKAASETRLKLGEDFTPLAAGGSGLFDAPLVFAGYGITAKDLKREGAAFSYDDYAGLDVKGKVVVLLRKEPQQRDEKSPFSGKEHSQYATFARKLSNAAERGAAAVIFVNDSLEGVSRREQDTKLLKAAADKLSSLSEKLSSTPAGEEAFDQIAAEIAKASAEAAEIGKQLAGGRDGLLQFKVAGEDRRHKKLPVLFATRAAIDKLLTAAGSKDLAALEKEIDSDLTPRSLELAGWSAKGEAVVIEKKATVKNVVAVLEGSGPLADETIVVGTHYDHLGHGGEGSLAPWTTDIHNGADDNASGTAALLEIARRLATAPEKPRRRIVFIAFTGEEKGLLGSAHYTRQPRFPLEKTVAMFNLDMVGRLKDEKLIVYGTGTAKEFDPLAERLSREGGFQLTKHAGGFGPSDHSSFYSKKIPVLHLFTGTHNDYHRPSDDSPKLNIAGMRRVAEWIVGAVQATDAAEARPTYVEIRRIERISDSAEAGERPSFGSMPAYPNPALDGVLLEAVLEGSPAEKAGIKGGDVLLKLGDARVMNLEDFQAALVGHKPGDTVKVQIRRGKETIDAEVTLGRRRGP